MWDRRGGEVGGLRTTRTKLNSAAELSNQAGPSQRPARADAAMLSFWMTNITSLQIVFDDDGDFGIATLLSKPLFITKYF